MYTSTTRGIRISVMPTFLEEQSAPEKGRFVWAYTVSIENTGPEVVQLLTRHWRIADATGRQIEVKGEGVVGQQPVLGPGERFEYTSGTPLETGSGFMTGSYGMVTAEGEAFDVAIPAFSLDSPHTAPGHVH